MDEIPRTRQQGHAARAPKLTKEDMKQATLNLMTYSTAQVGEILQVSTLHVLRLLDRGTLIGYKEGMEWRVPYHELKAYQVRKAQATPEAHARHSSAVRNHINLPQYQAA